MPSFRFIHCSDLHIDSPFKGFTSLHPELATRLQQATLRSFMNIVDLAVKEQVHAVVIAGDVFDGADRSLQAQLKFRRGLQRLTDAGIPALVAHGNHDPLNTWSATMDWPEGVTLFSGEEVESVAIERDGQTLARIQGISFPERDVFDNLALRFKKAKGEGFAIGVLHANVGGNPDHDKYAPCGVDDLAKAGMDYWALGHIHAHEVIQKASPAIVYCGNSQARHFKETGAKGCCLVTLQKGAPPEIEFVATDEARFVRGTVDLTPVTHWDQAVQAIRRQLEQQAGQAQGRDVLVRLTLKGRTVLHEELQKGGALEALQTEVLHFFEDHAPWVWVELVPDTHGTYDVEALRQGKDFIADIITLYDQTPDDLADVRALFAPLLETWQGSHLLEEMTDDELRGLMVKARDLTLDQLVDRD